MRRRNFWMVGVGSLFRRGLLPLPNQQLFALGPGCFVKRWSFADGGIIWGENQIVNEDITQIVDKEKLKGGKKPLSKVNINYPDVL